VTEYPVGATETTARVVEALAAGGETGVTELAEEIGLSKASAHNHLVTLQRLGVVVSEDGRYRLGLRFLDVGMTVRDRLPAYRAAREELTGLAESAGETVGLVVAEHGSAVYAAVRRPERNDRRVQTGSRLPLHATASGKALLSARSPEAVASYVEETTLAARTDRTIQTASALRAELRSVADRGLAFDRGEAFEGVRGVAAPVRAEGEAVAALTVVGPAARLSGKRLEEDLTGLVLSAAKRVELTLAE
jgi:DNA-binding IclR family transcriptional regulator